MATTWEALQSPGWQDSQLRMLQTEWHASDIEHGWLAALNMERAAGLDIFARCRGNPNMMRVLDDLGIAGTRSSSGMNFFEELVKHPDEAGKRARQFFIISGWMLWFSYDDERWSLNFHQTWLNGVRDAIREDAFERAFTRMLADSKQWEDPPGKLLVSSSFLPALVNAHKGFARLETVRRLTFTAIALHRHRLKHEKFPESLRALVPEFLTEVPRDFMDGQPLRYKLQPDGQFLLWSVGEDFKDGGGDPTPVDAPSSNPFAWLKGRDWVWPLPASSAEVESYHYSLRTKK